MTDQPSRPSGYDDRPDYRVTVLRHRNRVTATIDGRVIADSGRTLFVDEQDHALVVYFPREDVDMAVLTPVDGRTSQCPYKGDAHYFALAATPADPIAWSYADPYRDVAVIAGHVAFYQERIAVRLGADARTA